ncbi:MAG TPA: glycosyltransferase family 2 protein [Cyclobacteriaceae bacterium]|nr:glycosyltransferase family 2 protein [Cyclobacteriaceae bacterium]
MEISVVVTLLNEEENVKPLLGQLYSALNGMDYEIILVDDGSTDATAKEIKAYANNRTKLISLTRNFGQTPAIAAGIDHTVGEFIVTMDGDLQNDPADIPPMLNKLKTEGWDVVAGYRRNRQDDFFLRKIPSRIANHLIRNSTGVFIHDYGCTLKIFKKEIAKGLDLYGELHRFIPVLAVLQGGKITEMDVHHHARVHGKSKYGIGRVFKVMSDLLLMVFFQKYFKRPIHLFGPIGFVCLLLGGAINFYLLIVKIMGADIWGRPILILGITLLLAGIQFLTFGLIAELMMRIYFESQHKKTYSVREIYSGTIRPEKSSLRTMETVVT